MYNIAIIGAGQLGSRHLQGLAKSTKQFQIYVIDPNEKSLIVAKNRFKEVSKPTNSKVSYLKNISGVPENIDLAIIATTANVRREVVERLLEQCHLKYLILEKVVFQKSEDFNYIQKLLIDNGIKSWINCTRRTFPFYKKLKKKNLGEKIIIKVEGNNWGLACNSIHMIDLLVFLTGKTDIKININKLENIIFNSKRNNFKEIKGTLKIYTNHGDTLELNDQVKYDGKHKISISNSRIKFNIFEGESLVIRDKSDNKIHEEKISVPFQSELTGRIVDQILDTGESDLTPYTECMQYHVPMLDAFNKHFSRVTGKDVEICPIT